MNNKEFIKAVNALDNSGEFEAALCIPTGAVLLRKCGFLVASLEKHDIEWCFTPSGASTVPTKILKLMVEMAESREEGY